MNLFAEYIQDIETALRTGNATEHTHRPALKKLIESFNPGIVATNEPKRIKCGAPDFVISEGQLVKGYIEAKDVGVSLNKAQKSAQITRYVKGLANLILTDYLEFRWYVGGENRLTARLAAVGKNDRLKLESSGIEQVSQLLSQFLQISTPQVNTPKELAQQMASLAQLIRDAISRALDDRDKGGMLREQLESFQKVLIKDLTSNQFADMYAQTICYGLFAARCNTDNPEKFSRETAAFKLPKTNPFLRSIFGQSVPLTSNPELFQRLCLKGGRLVNLHLMKTTGAELTSYPQPGDNKVEKVHYDIPKSPRRESITSPSMGTGGGSTTGRVWINKTQYFDGVPPEVWNFYVGGYQVCQKWLKDRKDRVLEYDDLTHYQNIVAALAETIELMKQIDDIISESGGFPIH
ncbi:MAG: hypothetical protein EBE86_023040 [Hormoscilla sp. GUM202]|nr:hypothetical protein [Hormoscilla sp. GUM202]